MLSRYDTEKLFKDIKILSELIGLNEYVIEKDVYVTEAIAAVSNLSHEFYDLLFQGGTSLAKAHRIIERMSEDCDFRIRFKEAGKSLSRERKRKVLREFRHKLIAALKEKGFVIEPADIVVRNEGQFMGIKAKYPSAFSRVDSIKPFIALDFYLAEIRLEPEVKPVTTLIHQTFGDKVEHQSFPVNSVAIVETAAEKWVGLTRRVATKSHREYYYDPNLVRHLYDLYKIEELGHFSDEFPALASSIVLEDGRRYRNHNEDYYEDPIREIERAVNELSDSTDWHQHWEQFTKSMVFAEQKPSYEDVLNNLQQKAQLVLNVLRNEA